MSGVPMMYFCQAGAERYAPFTRREWEVLQLVAQGLSNRQIGRRLGIHEKVVAKHVSSLFDVFLVMNRTQLALLAVRYGLASEEEAFTTITEQQENRIGG